MYHGVSLTVLLPTVTGGRQRFMIWSAGVKPPASPPPLETRHEAPHTHRHTTAVGPEVLSTLLHVGPRARLLVCSVVRG